jgi:murein DD-endopeptidase MepM/ murein hydrolase activator NlpD
MRLPDVYRRLMRSLREQRFLLAGLGLILSGALLTVFFGPPPSHSHGALARRVSVAGVGSAVRAPTRTEVAPAEPLPASHAVAATGVGEGGAEGGEAKPAAAVSATVPHGGEPAAVPGPWQEPVAGRLAAGFGWVDIPWRGEWVYHTGWDIRTAPGAVVRAVAPGVVVAVTGTGGGVAVVEAVGDLRVRYGGLEAVPVAVGAALEAGTPIGRVATVEGLPLLSLSIEEGGGYIDPAHYLARPG